MSREEMNWKANRKESFASSVERFAHRNGASRQPSGAQGSVLILASSQQKMER
jgi:hypothetical protein